jgi:uncharacterized protein (UPF0218 family)
MDDTQGRFMTAESREKLQGFAEERFGKAKALERMKAQDGVFTVGDFVTVRGSLFKVEAINESLLTLRLLLRT